MNRPTKNNNVQLESDDDDDDNSNHRLNNVARRRLTTDWLILTAETSTWLSCPVGPFIGHS